MGAVRIDKYYKENDIDEALPPDYAYYEYMILMKPHPLTTPFLAEYMIRMKQIYEYTEIQIFEYTDIQTF